MYEAFFGLRESPFSIAPNPAYLYMSRQHDEALGHLVYGVGREGGVVLLTGEVGTGKTTICRCFLEQLPPNTNVALILVPMLDSRGLLEAISRELGISLPADESTSEAGMVHAIHNWLLDAHARGEHTVLIVDEAQTLSVTLLEQLRLLTNLETCEKKLLQIVLLGQPELLVMFARPELRQLSQRVTARFHLESLGREEIAPYVRHRLSVAGCQFPDVVFPARAIRRIQRLTQGVPRMINVLCDRALLGAYSCSSRTVTAAMIDQAACEVLHPSVPVKASRVRLTVLSCLLSVVAAGAGLTIYDSHPWTGGEASQREASASPSPPPQASSHPPEITDTPPNPNKPSAPERIDPESLAMSEAQAISTAFHALGIKNPAPDTLKVACERLRKERVGCFSRIASLAYLTQLDWPALATLSGKKMVLIVGESNGMLELSDPDGARTVVDSRALAASLSGEFTVMWSYPPGYAGYAVNPGASSPLVPWVKSMLLSLNPDLSFDTSHRYATDVETLVRKFQSEHGEPATGVLDELTLIRLRHFGEQARAAKGQM